MLAKIDFLLILGPLDPRCASEKFSILKIFLVDRVGIRTYDPLMKSQGSVLLHIKSEVHNISILYDVFFSFDT